MPNGVKKSNFLAWGNNPIPSGGYIDFTYNGKNYKQSYTNFLSNLGVTGSIVQDGAATGTPVLEISGAINRIRNLEDGPGILTSVSAENGIKVEHNFTEDTAGAKLVTDLTALQPVLRSIVAGSGINVSASGDAITIAVSGVPATTKTVVVNALSDLPIASGGVITLADDTEYAFRNDVNLGVVRLVMGNNTVLNGSDSSLITLTYTDTGNMITSTNKNWTLRNIAISCTSGSFVDFNGSGNEIFQLLSCKITAATLGTIDSFRGIQFDDTQFIVTTDGFTFGGSNGVMLAEANLTTIAAGSLYDLGSATFDALSITHSFVTLNGSSVFLTGAASSANINAGGLGSVHNCRFFGAGTPLSTIAVGDARWQFSINDDILDSHYDSLLSLIGNATNTVISVATTPVKLAGTWTVESETHFTGDTTGRTTYNGLKDLHIDVTATAKGAPVSGTKTLTYYIAVNGTVVTNSKVSSSVSAGSPARAVIAWRLILSPGDYVELFVANDSDTTDVLVSDAVLRMS